jgi:dTMP kinase
MELSFLNHFLSYIDKEFSILKNIPLYSFEGLPGSGKSTQANLVLNKLNSQSYQVHYLELPTPSPYGDFLHYHYQDLRQFLSLKQTDWHINILFLLLDFLQGIKQAHQNKAEFIIMSRGILSTYYYNLDIESKNNLDFNSIIKKLDLILSHFPPPTKIFFLDVQPSLAYERVQLRKDKPTRIMDNLDQLVRDKDLFESMIIHFSPRLRIQKIDGSLDSKTLSELIVSDIIDQHAY